jgi:hypothetical protein
MTPVPKKFRLSLMFFSSESTRVSTVIIAKIPTVTPSKERIVRNKLDFNALQANLKLSKI